VAQAPLELQWPVACKLGETCMIQHYVDHDPGPEAKDYQCGTVTYDQHSGTDIRLLTTAAQRAGVDVLAAAPGRVLRTRDGMEDVSVRKIDRASIAGKHCGNGMVIGHEGGWETQYCHMAKGSVRVRPGDTVTAGQVLGRIGISGDSEFPHLHLTVRHAGKLVDPFAYDAPPNSCGGGQLLWAPNVRAAFKYHAGEVLNAGFSAIPVTMEDIEAGAGEKKPGRDAPALIAFVRAITLRKGDVQELTLTGPDGQKLAGTTPKPLDRNKAQYMMFVGKKKPSGDWPAGEYVARYTVTRDGRVALEKMFSLQL
jgi:hypothetical protein